MLTVNLLPKQWDVFSPAKGVDYDIALYQGGVGCVDGDTLINLASGGVVPIKDFDGGYVLAWSGEQFVSAWATKPATYEAKPLYRVRTSGGQEILCTSAHRFLTPAGWERTDRLRAGDVLLVSPASQQASMGAYDPLLFSGELLQECDYGPQSTSLEFSPSAHTLNAERSAQTTLNCQGDYSVYSHQYGAPPLAGQDSAQAFPPLPTGALLRSRQYWHAGDLCNELTDNHLCQSSFRHSMTGFGGQKGSVPEVLALYYAGGNISEQLLQIYQQSHLSLKNLTLAQRDQLFSAPFPSQSCSSPFKPLLNQRLTESIIKSIEYVKTDCYYDLHVPGFNNYLAHGFINHNSGKTFLGCLTGLSVCAANPGCTWLVGADTYSRLAISTCDTYEQVLNDANIRYKFNKSEHIIRIPGWDNARILFKGLDDPQSLRSVNGIGGHIEEASLITEAAYLEFLGRLRQAKPGMPIRVILTTNPQTSKGWLFDHFVERGGVVEQPVRGSTIKVHRRRVIAATIDNPYVSDAFLATLRASYDDKLYRVMVLGLDGDYTEGLVNYNFSDINITNTEYKPDLTVHLTCDFNVDPMSWGLAHRYNGEYHFFDEIVIENCGSVENAVDEFVRRYPNHTGNIVINGDASGNNRDVRAANDDGKVKVLNKSGTAYTIMLNRFSYHNYPAQIRVDIRQHNPPPSDRVAAWNAMVCNTDGVRRVFVNPRCRWLIWNCNNLKYKEGTGIIDEPTVKDIEKDRKLKFTKHIWDAASYLVEKYDPIILKAKREDSKVIVPKGLKFRA